MTFRHLNRVAFTLYFFGAGSRFMSNALLNTENPIKDVKITVKPAIENIFAVYINEIF